MSKKAGNWSRYSKTNPNATRRYNKSGFDASAYVKPKSDGVHAEAQLCHISSDHKTRSEAMLDYNLSKNEARGYGGRVAQRLTLENEDDTTVAVHTFTDDRDTVIGGSFAHKSDAGGSICASLEHGVASGTRFRLGTTQTVTNYDGTKSDFSLGLECKDGKIGIVVGDEECKIQ